MKWINLCIIGLLYFCSACSNDVDFGEQYKKQVYIVNANLNGGIIDASLMMEEAAQGSISIYCASSEFPEEDVIVHYAIDTAALNAYNLREFETATDRYLKAIPEEFVTFGSETVTIRQGEPYAVLPFTINTAALDPSVNNVLPITLTDASGYEINPELQTCFYQLDLSNKYSGEYSCTVTFINASSKIFGENFVTKTVTAAGMTQIKVPQRTLVTVDEDNPNYFVLNLNEADNSVTLTSPVEGFQMIETLEIIDDNDNVETIKVNYYNPDTQEFIVCYQFPSTMVTYEILKKK